MSILTRTTGNRALDIDLSRLDARISALESGARTQNGKAVSTTNQTVAASLVAPGFANPMSAVGDMIVGASGGLPARLAADADGKVLTLAGGTPAWLSDTVTFRGCRVYASASYNAADGVARSCAYDSEAFDTSAYHDPVTNNSRITIPTGLGGYYLITGLVEWDANLTGERRIWVLQNGATVLAYTSQAPVDAAHPTRQMVSCIAHLAQTDYIELEVLQSSGGPLAVYPHDTTAGGFMLAYLGA